jgi:hypothetical protein
MKRLIATLMETGFGAEVSVDAKVERVMQKSAGQL